MPVVKTSLTRDRVKRTCRTWHDLRACIQLLRHLGENQYAYHIDS